ncbi:MAG: BglII/BstYI family type II restriction endonuclease [Dehalococcoidia bacterium]|nr:BglII/BstYI family type II restriction endonuclease [Dehalococcoidia bacterium]
MKLSLEKFSYLSGETRLNSKPGIIQEIEEVFLRPRIDITMLSLDQFLQLSRADFLARGWDPPAVVRGRGGQMPLAELIKQGVGLQLGFRSPGLLADILKFQAMYDSREAKIDIGVYVVGTSAFQNVMRKETGKPWAGLSFYEVTEKLPSIGRMLKVPICLLGLNAVEESPSVAGNINHMSSSQVKETVFAFLERKYGRPIDQNVRVMGMGRGLDIEFDGILRLDDEDVILEVEVSTEGVLRSRILADSTRSFTKMLQDYRRLMGRKASLRFIFLGEFNPRYISRVLDQRDDVSCESGGAIVDYEVYRFEDLGLTDKQNISSI